jgi:hypothetical protein
MRRIRLMYIMSWGYEDLKREREGRGQFKLSRVGRDDAPYAVLFGEKGTAASATRGESKTSKSLLIDSLVHHLLQGSLSETIPSGVCVSVVELQSAIQQQWPRKKEDFTAFIRPFGRTIALNLRTAP